MDALFPFLTRHHWLAPVRRPLVAPVFRNQRLRQDLTSHYPNSLLQPLVLQDKIRATTPESDTTLSQVSPDINQVAVDDALLHDMGADVCYSKPQPAMQTWLPLLLSAHPESSVGGDAIKNKDRNSAKQITMQTPTADTIAGASRTSPTKSVTTQQPSVHDVQYQHIDIEV